MGRRHPHCTVQGVEKAASSMGQRLEEACRRLAWSAAAAERREGSERWRAAPALSAAAAHAIPSCRRHKLAKDASDTPRDKDKAGSPSSDRQEGALQAGPSPGRPLAVTAGRPALF